MLKAGYVIGIYLYRFMVFFAAFLGNKKAKLWIEGRKNWEKHLRDLLSSNMLPVVWIHAASLGEYEMAMPLINKTDQTKYRVLVSFFSPSGYENIIKKNNPHLTTYLPLDTKSNAHKFVQIVKPVKVVFVKYDIWYFHLKEVLNNSIELYFITGVFTPKHWFIKYKAQFILNVLKKVNTIFTIDKASADTLDKVGITNTMVAGDTRCDRVYDNTQVAFEDKKIDSFIGTGFKILIAGSTWPEDEGVLKNSLPYLIKNGWKLIIAPHEIHQKKTEKLCSDYNAVSYTNFNNEDTNVLIIDTMGSLKYIYRYASVTYVGGAFKQGLHNVLEPAAYGKPIIFGPEYEKYSEAKALIENNAAFSLNNEIGLSVILEKLSNENELINSGNKALKYVMDNIGASSKIYGEIFK